MCHVSVGSKRLFLAVLVACVGLGTAGAATKHVNVGQGGGLNFVDVTNGTSTTTINAGDTVTWDWVSGFHSTASTNLPCCSPNGMWDSGAGSGLHFSFTFPNPGTFHYYCTVHGSVMQGTVVVNAVTPPDFGISVSNPNGGTVAGPIFPTQQTTFNGTISPVNGYNNTVNLSCVSGATGVPSQCNPSPASVMVSSSTPFTIAAGATTPGHYDFKARATDGINTRLFPGSVPGLNFDVVDFGIGAPTSAVTVFAPAGGSANSTSTTVTLSGSGAFNGNVALSCSAGLPAGATCSFDSPGGMYMPTAAIPVTATVRISVPAATAAQDYSVTLSALSSTGAGPVTKTQPLTLHVVQFSAGAFSPASVTIGAGNVSNPATSPLTASANFSGSVMLACTAGLPPGGACNFTTNPVTTFPSSTSVMASAPTNTAAGTYNLTISATGSMDGLSSNQTLPLMLNVPPPGFALGTPSPASVSMIDHSFSQPVTVAITPLNFSGVVNLGCGNLPAGITCLFSPSPTLNVNAASSFVVVFESNGATPSTNTNITIMGSATVNGTPINQSVGLTQLAITAPATSTTIASSLAGLNSATGGTLVNVGDPNLVFTVTVNNTGSVYSAAVWEVDFSSPVRLVASSNPNCSQVVATAITCNVGDIPATNGNKYSFNVAPLFGRSVVAQSLVTSPTVGSTNLAGNQASATVQVRPRPLARRGLTPKIP